MKSFAEKTKLSIEYGIVDGIILTLFCYYGVLVNLTSDNVREKEHLLIIVIYLGWLISAATTHKFIPVIFPTKRWKAFEFKLNFYIWFIALIIIATIIVPIEIPSSIYLIKAIIGYSILSALISTYFFVIYKKTKPDEVTVKFLKAYEIKDHIIQSNIKNHQIKYGYKVAEETESIKKEQLQFEYLKEYKDVFTVLGNILDFKTFDPCKTAIIKTNDSNDISLFPSSSFQLIISLHHLNNQYKINNYLLGVRKTLAAGGVYVGVLRPDCYRYQRYHQNCITGIRDILYFFDFVWKRIFPKLPILREIYWTINKGNDRAISLAEGLGRLIYSGFKILDMVVLDDCVFFAAVKNGVHVPEKKNFYSIIFKMNRIGKGGKPIYVYKLRTMHPYSEYIQDYIYELNGYKESGKIRDDFRVATWGKFLRKYWIDELPMIINLLKGDLKLVGVRPLSSCMFNQYPTDLQELRISTKPGLIPPFYNDLPKTFDEILESERKYLLDYKRNPIKTDIRYFFKCWYNIFIKTARSE